MVLRIFLIGAIVLTVFGIIAGAAANGMMLGTTWFVWFMAAFLSFLVDILFGGYGYANGAWGRSDRQ